MLQIMFLQNQYTSHNKGDSAVSTSRLISVNTINIVWYSYLWQLQPNFIGAYLITNQLFTLAPHLWLLQSKSSERWCSVGRMAIPCTHPKDLGSNFLWLCIPRLTSFHYLNLLLFNHVMNYSCFVFLCLCIL